MNKKIIVGHNYEYDYKLIIDDEGEHHILNYSTSDCWNDNIKGTKAFELIDNGWDILTPNISKIDYSELEQYFILINIIYRQNQTKLPIEIVDQTTKII